ncbi:MHYT domain-containing protein [Nonomuraea sp. LPB2021202275-12-8]|uniref:MHYT domain-containing protein n=1 Tax=Nonomuraea sp. LPB2021202275-12-8 TaxID=3120159 RepID=UPI00300C1B43
MLTPVLAYVMSSVGSMLGLLLTSRARLVSAKEGRFWLVGAAVAIGGTGIWTMHFIAMMGFAVRGTVIRYDVPLTVVSAVIAITVVGAGLFLVQRGGERRPFLLAGGALAGLGVAGMHYLGMAAMNMSAHLSYDPLIVAASMAIAVAAATTALWFTIRVRGALRIGGAALVMGVAVTGMHYTGMHAMSVEVHEMTAPIAGARPIDFMLPLIVGISVVTMGLLLAVVLSPSERELRKEQEFLDRLHAKGAPEVDFFGTPRG